MKYNQNHLSLAVRLALSMGLLTTAGLAQAQQAGNDDAANTSQAQAKAQASKAKNLQAVTVTGSLIRRVDVETANPVVNRPGFRGGYLV